MLKKHVTRKELEQSYNTIINLGYSGQSIIKSHQDANYYNGGVYGWNFDAYDFEGILLVISYRNTPRSRNSKTGLELHNIIKEYEEKARNIIRDFRPWEEQKELLKENCRQFISEAIKEV